MPSRTWLTSRTCNGGPGGGGPRYGTLARPALDAAVCPGRARAHGADRTQVAGATSPARTRVGGGPVRRLRAAVPRASLQLTRHLVTEARVSALLCPKFHQISGAVPRRDRRRSAWRPVVPYRHPPPAPCRPRPRPDVAKSHHRARVGPASTGALRWRYSRCVFSHRSRRGSAGRLSQQLKDLCSVILHPRLCRTCSSPAPTLPGGARPARVPPHRRPARESPDR